MRGLLFFISTFLIMTGALKAENQFKLGQHYQNILTLNIKNSSDQQFPLPAGKWVVTATSGEDARRSISGTQASSGTKLAMVYLANIEDGKLKAAIRIRYTVENYSSGWSVPTFCSRNNLNFDGVKSAYDGTQTDCWGVSYARGASKPGTPGARSIKYLQDLGVKIPIVVVYSQHYLADMSEYLAVGYLFNPEFEGISRPENAGSFRTVDYHPTRIGNYPEKKAYVEKIVNWSKKWKKYIYQGFRGKLTLEQMGLKAHQ